MSENEIITDVILARACERMRSEALDIVAGHDDLYEQIAALPNISTDMLDLPDSLFATAAEQNSIDLYLDLAFMLLIGMAIGLTWMLVF